MARDWKKTIRDLLNKAYSLPEDSPERKTYETNAYAYMAEKGIQEASLNLGSTPESVTETKVWFPNPYGRSKARLYNMIMDAMNVYVLKLSAKKHGVTMYHLFGYQADIDRGEFLYEVLLQQAITLVTRVKAPPGENLTSFRVSWWIGFNSAIRERLAEANSRAVSEAREGTALVLVERKDRAESMARVQYPSIVHTRDTYRGSGFRKGNQAGHNASLYGGNSVSGARGMIRQ